MSLNNPKPGEIYVISDTTGQRIHLKISEVRKGSTQTIICYSVNRPGDSTQEHQKASQSEFHKMVTGAPLQNTVEQGLIYIYYDPEADFDIKVYRSGSYVTGEEVMAKQRHNNPRT